MDLHCLYSGDEILKSLFDRYPETLPCENELRTARAIATDAFRKGRKLLVCGNGGSAADSEHITGELMKSFRFKRPLPRQFKAAYKALYEEEAPGWLDGALPTISLVSQTALLTAFGNDESEKGIFAQQVLGYGKEGDVLLAISTSGNSVNVVEAAKVAKVLKMKVVSLTGSAYSELTPLSNVCVRVPRSEVFQVQELHLPIYHCLCAAIEADIFGGANHD